VLSKESPTEEFKVNDFITLKLEKGKTIIYINDKKFLHCKYLLIDIPINKIKDFDDINSIDEVSDKLDHSLEEGRFYQNVPIEMEFWGHCSNLQTWVENQYDTRLLHSNLAFPLLKKLTDVGDPMARRVFKDEIALRMVSGYKGVITYLIQENYLEYLNEEELEVLHESLKKMIANEFKRTYRDVIFNTELKTLVDLITENVRNSKTLLTTRLKKLDTINRKTHMGFSIENQGVHALALNKCRLTNIPDSIQNLTSLERLYLEENTLRNLPEEIGQLEKLKSLYLENNQLKALPESIGELKSLEELFLDHNSLQKLPETIKSLSSLKILSIWGNNLNKIPDAIRQLKALKILGLSFNHLKSFPDALTNLKSLQNLDLSHNKLTRIPATIRNLDSLKVLWLNNNNLKSLPESICELPSLQQIYLFSNPIINKLDAKSKSILKKLVDRGINYKI